MIGLLRTFFNAICGWLARQLGDVTSGAGATVRWWGLRSVVHGGRIKIGRDSIVRCRIYFDSPQGLVSIGDRCYLGASHFVCHTAITIGDDVIISWGATIVDHDSHSLSWEERKNDVADWKRGIKRWESVTVRPVCIENKAWIGFGASILKGVTVGEGAVVGANAVVTRDVLPYTVVAGNPAKIIRKLKEG
jgi:acetyltransferase-like isoleucine patch superfamily enzyme